MWAPRTTVCECEYIGRGMPFLNDILCVISLCISLSSFVVCVCIVKVLTCCVVLLLVDDFPLAGQARMPWAVEMEALFILSLQHCTRLLTNVATTLYTDYHTTL